LIRKLYMNKKISKNNNFITLIALLGIFLINFIPNLAFGQGEWGHCQCGLCKLQDDAPPPTNYYQETPPTKIETKDPVSGQTTINYYPSDKAAKIIEGVTMENAEAIAIARAKQYNGNFAPGTNVALATASDFGYILSEMLKEANTYNALMGAGKIYDAQMVRQRYLQLEGVYNASMAALSAGSPIIYAPEGLTDKPVAYPISGLKEGAIKLIAPEIGNFTLIQVPSITLQAYLQYAKYILANQEDFSNTQIYAASALRGAIPDAGLVKDFTSADLAKVGITLEGNTWKFGNSVMSTSDFITIEKALQQQTLYGRVDIEKLIDPLGTIGEPMKGYGSEIVFNMIEQLTGASAPIAWKTTVRVGDVTYKYIGEGNQWLNEKTGSMANNTEVENIIYTLYPGLYNRTIATSPDISGGEYAINDIWQEALRYNQLVIEGHIYTREYNEADEVFYWVNKDSNGNIIAKIDDQSGQALKSENDAEAMILGLQYVTDKGSVNIYELSRSFQNLETELTWRLGDQADKVIQLIETYREQKSPMTAEMIKQELMKEFGFTTEGQWNDFLINNPSGQAIKRVLDNVNQEIEIYKQIGILLPSASTSQSVSNLPVSAQPISVQQPSVQTSQPSSVVVNYPTIQNIGGQNMVNVGSGLYVPITPISSARNTTITVASAVNSAISSVQSASSIGSRAVAVVTAPISITSAAVQSIATNTAAAFSTGVQNVQNSSSVGGVIVAAAKGAANTIATAVTTTVSAVASAVKSTASAIGSLFGW
jgi:hypothetical protein